MAHGFNDNKTKFNIDNAGHAIKNENGAFTQRKNLKFVGATVTDDSTNDATVVTIESGGGSGISASDIIEASASVRLEFESYLETESGFGDFYMENSPYTNISDWSSEYDYIPLGIISIGYSGTYPESYYDRYRFNIINRRLWFSAEYRGEYFPVDLTLSVTATFLRIPKNS